MIPLATTKSFDVYSHCKVSKILIELKDGGRAFMRHKSISVICVHRSSKDKLKLVMTNKENYYRFSWNPLTNEYLPEEKIREDTFKEELNRIGCPEFTFEKAQTRLILEL